MTSSIIPAPVSAMIPRTLFNADHEVFRTTVRRFFETEVAPNLERYEEQQSVDRALWTKAGELGLLCATIPEEYGGAGVDRLYSVIVIEEQGRVGDSATGFSLHSDIVANYINNFGNHEQKSDWLPKMATGEVIGAIAMTEPGTGSDLQAVKTTAVDKGDHYLLNGGKTFITNGLLSDLVIVVAKTGDPGEGAKSMSLLLVDTRSEGFSKGKPLKKVGMRGQDTCELFFNNVRVPKANLLGEEGKGFLMLMEELAWERTIIGVITVAAAESALAHTLEYVKQRKAFGKPVAAFQNTRFKLAELRAEVQIGRVYLDRCLELILQQQLQSEAASTAKLWCSEMCSRVVDECVQLHGGYGYMLEYPIARIYLDTRGNRIYGGTNEIMKEIISRTL